MAGCKPLLPTYHWSGQWPLDACSQWFHHQYAHIYNLHVPRNPLADPASWSSEKGASLIMGKSGDIPFPHVTEGYLLLSPKAPSPHNTWEKMSTRCPPSLRFLSIFCSSNNFPDALIRALPSYMPLGILGASWGKKQKNIESKPNRAVLTQGRTRGGTAYHCSHGKEIWVVAALLKIHHHIQQRDLVATTSSIKCFKISSEDILVVFPAWAREEG